MAIELKVPSVGESIKEVELGDWLKNPGDKVRQDETLVVIESDKASVDVPAPVSGTLTKILKKKRERAAVGEVIAYIEAGEVNGASSGKTESKRMTAIRNAAPAAAPAPAAPVPAPQEAAAQRPGTIVMPAARR